MARSDTPKKHTLKDGTVVWKAVVDAGPDPATGKRRQRRGTFPTQKAAKAWIAATRTDVAKGTYVPPTKTTLGEYLDTWIAGRVDVKPTTRRNYEDALKPVRARLAARPLQALTVDDVQAVVAGMLDGSLRTVGKAGTPLSARSVRLTLTILGQALDDAVKAGHLPRNVARLVKRPKQTTARKGGWEPAQVEAFLAAIEDHPMGGAFRLSLHGLRRGEVCGLRWDDVDLDAGEVTVRRSRVLVAGVGVVEQEDAKTKAAARTVWLGPGTTAALERLRLAQDLNRHDAGKAWVETGLVVVDPMGLGLRPDHYADLFVRTARDAGLPVISLHQARHAFGSYLIHKGLPIPVVSRLLGYSDPSITMAIYAHALEDGSKDAVTAALQAVGL